MSFALRLNRSAFFALFFVLCSIPVLLLAQESISSEDATVLRSEIRLALLADARSSDLSEEEVAMLVESLAGEAEAQGIASEFLPEKAPLPGAEAAKKAWDSLSEPALYGIILVSLALAMVLMKRIIDIHHAHQTATRVPQEQTPPSDPPILM